MAGTTTIHHTPSDGSLVARGVTTGIDDGETIDTGLIRADGFLATSATADTVVTMASQSAGVVTIGASTAGVAVSAGVTVYWVAWCRTHKG